MSEKHFLSEFIGMQMKSRNWSLRHTARQLKISPSYLSLILNHHVIPKPAILEKVAKNFDVSYSYLFLKTGLFENGPFNSRVKTALLQVCHNISIVADVLTQFAKYFHLNVDRKSIDIFATDFESRDVYGFFEGIRDDGYEWVTLLLTWMHDSRIPPQTGGKILCNIEKIINKRENKTLVDADLLYYLFDCIPTPFFNKYYAPLYADLLSMYSRALTNTIEQFQKSGADINSSTFPKEFEYFLSEERNKAVFDKEEISNNAADDDDNDVSGISEINISTNISGDKASIILTVPRGIVDILLTKILNLVK
ncbi:helix-turn-helix domain-containing protein [Desulfofundulus sp.]|uniref:helix-turn-helix domain-containing protein n=1 Tax=Desulfofundulus sp. TaxID=2282750 RepID=UPI003C72B703